MLLKDKDKTQISSDKLGNKSNSVLVYINNTWHFSKKTT